TLANPEGVLRPGTFARVRFDLGESRDVVVVPQTAVSFNPYGNSVYVLAEAPDEVKNAEVQEGEQAPQHVVKQRFVTPGPTRGDSGLGVGGAPDGVEDAEVQEGAEAPQHVVKQRLVTTGPTRGDLVGITDGLKPGEGGVSSGLLRLRNDAAVIINNTVAPQADAAPTPENR